MSKSPKHHIDCLCGVDRCLLGPPKQLPPPTVEYRTLPKTGHDPLRLTVAIAAILFFLIGLGVGSNL